MTTKWRHIGERAWRTEPIAVNPGQSFEVLTDYVDVTNLTGTTTPLDPSKDIDEYGKFVDDFWFSSGVKGGPLTDRDFRIMELGLAGEVGEVMELLKKNVRDGNLDPNQLKKELGDVAYYWARICSAHGFKPSEVLEGNRTKLAGRLQRDTLRGSGNDR